MSRRIQQRGGVHATRLPGTARLKLLHPCNKTTLCAPCCRKNNSFACPVTLSLDNRSRPASTTTQDSSAELEQALFQSKEI